MERVVETLIGNNFITKKAKGIKVSCFRTRNFLYFSEIDSKALRQAADK